jgi:hypothetical protein
MGVVILSPPKRLKMLEAFEDVQEARLLETQAGTKRLDN